MLLLLEQFLLLDSLVLGLNGGGVPDAVKVRLRDDDGVILRALLGLASNITQLLKGDDTLRRSDGGTSSDITSSLASTKEGLINLRALTSTGSDLFKYLKSISEEFIEAIGGHGIELRGRGDRHFTLIQLRLCPMRFPRHVTVVHGALESVNEDFNYPSFIN